MSMTQTTIYRNDATGYVVTLIDSGRGARVTDSLGHDFPMVGADYPHAALLAKSRAHHNGAVEVPAPADPYVPAGPPVVTPTGRAKLAARFGQEAADAAIAKVTRPLATGATLTMPELTQARCLAWARERSLHCRVMRGTASVTGQTATRTQLVGMARRGWLELDDPIRPSYGTITHAGRQAIIAYVAKHGEVL